jgi:hypothetical protein
MQTVLCDAVDHVPLVAANVVASFLEYRLDIRLELGEGLLVTTKKFTIDGIVGHIDGEIFDVGDIDERRVYSLKITREETPLLESLVSGEIISEFDGEVNIGRWARVTRGLRSERHCELYVRITTEELFEGSEQLRALLDRLHMCDTVYRRKRIPQDRGLD